MDEVRKRINSEEPEYDTPPVYYVAAALMLGTAAIVVCGVVLGLAMLVWIV